MTYPMLCLLLQPIRPIPFPAAARSDGSDQHCWLYGRREKAHCQNHLLPKQMKEHGLSGSKLQVNEEAILKLIRRYTREAGVRNLERELASICRKATKMIVSGEKKRVVVTENTLESIVRSIRNTAMA